MHIIKFIEKNYNYWAYQIKLLKEKNLWGHISEVNSKPTNEKYN